MLKKNILIVDDDEVMVDMSSMALGNVGHEVFCAYNGEQAIEMAMASKFDLVIIDGMLSGMSGVETLEALQQINPAIIGIFVTGQAELGMVIEAMNAGFSKILEKPFDASNLVKIIQETIDSTKIQEESTRLQTILPLYKLSEKFISATSLGEVYDMFLDAIAMQINVPSISLMMFVEEDDCMYIVASRGMDQAVAEKVVVRSGEKIAGWVYEHGQAIIHNKNSQENSHLAKHLQRKKLAASISFPLIGHEKTLGVLNISQTDENVVYSQSDIEVLSVISGQAIMALENVNYMRAREENIRTRALFEQYVAPEVAEVLLNSEENLMDVGDVRDISLLFADVHNFTLAVQHLSHKDIHLFLTQFFDLFSEVAFSWKGTLDKFMGDAALVAFGAPIELEHPSEAAIFTGVELSIGFEQLRQDWLKKFSVFEHLGLGIGISRGEVFQGNVGSSRRLDYTVIGTDVNIAQRLASETGTDTILITDSVYKNVTMALPMKKELPRRLRGLEHEVKLYSIKADTGILPEATLNR